MTLEQMNKLKGRSWATLERKAIEAGVSRVEIRGAATRDELRLAIIRAETEAYDRSKADPYDEAHGKDRP